MTRSEPEEVECPIAPQRADRFAGPSPPRPMLRLLLPSPWPPLLPATSGPHPESEASVATRGGIPWEEDWAAARARALEEGRVLFVAANMDGERANDRMAEDVYREKAVVALAEQPCPSSRARSPMGRAPARGSGPSAVSTTSRSTSGHGRKSCPPTRTARWSPRSTVFLAPDGTVLLSVEYEITADELEWCLGEALRKLDPDDEVKLSGGARPPKRWWWTASPRRGDRQPPTRDEVLELLRELKKGRMENRDAAVRRLLTADEDEAREFAVQELRRSGGGGRRGGGGGASRNEAGTGPLGASGADGASHRAPLPSVLVGGGRGVRGERRRGLRAEVAAALEQLQCPRVEAVGSGGPAQGARTRPRGCLAACARERRSGRQGIPRRGT